MSMGVLNSYNLRKAKRLLDRNRHKLGDIVEKAGGTLDKVSKGKTSQMTAKAAEAAKKYSDGARTAHDFGDGRSDPYGEHGEHPDAERMQAEAHAAGIAATNAMTNMANAAANMMNDPAVRQGVADAMSDPEVRREVADAIGRADDEAQRSAESG